MNKVIFLDRDGTIVLPGDHIHKIEELKLIPYVIKGLKKLQDKGYKFIIITNQAGIAKRLYKEEDYFIFRNEMNRRLKEKGILITAEYFCPHHKEGFGEYKKECKCRKPRIGMLEKAAKEFNLNLNKCWLIGDNYSDILAGKNAGCKTIHILTGEQKKNSNNANFIANNLIEAADYIINNKNT